MFFLAFIDILLYNIHTFCLRGFRFYNVCRDAINEKLFNEKIRVLCFMLEAGMNGHLAKPIDLLKMIELLREIFGEDK